MREVGRMAKPRTGEFGNPSPITVQFVQGVAVVDSGSGQENTPTSVPIYNASKVGLPLWSTMMSFTGASGKSPLMSVQVVPPSFVLNTWPLPSQPVQEPN